jgi:trimeric autotransporter adhesin
MKSSLRVFGAALLLLILGCFPSIAFGQGTAFTYQGQLQNNGIPANGLYGLRFRLFEDPLGENQSGNTILTNAVPVTNGVFVVAVDFGPGIFNGGKYWLEVDVTTNTTAGYSDLLPLQQVTAAPYAVFANTASNLSGTISAGQLNGSVPMAQLPANLVTNGESGITFAGVTLNGALNLATPEIFSGSAPLLYWASGLQNFFAGSSAGNPLNDSASFNTAAGAYSLFSNRTGSYNTASGAQALYSNSTGYGNTAVGGGALVLNTNGSVNTAIGMLTLENNQNGAYNTAAGYEALASLGSLTGAGGSNNIALGYNAGGNLIGNESDDIEIGNAGVTGENNIIRIGTPGIQTAIWLAGVINGDGSGLTDLNAGQLNGALSLSQLPGAVVTNNETAGVTLGNVTLNGTLNLPALPVTIESGGGSLLYADNNSNLFAGSGAGTQTTTGGFDTADGANALHSNTKGSYDTAIGCQALKALSGGSNNIAIGFGAGSAFQSTESSNIDIGNAGIAGESGTVRIGTNQKATYLAGTVYANNQVLVSDRNAKEKFTPVSVRSVLDKVVSLPVTEWSYKSDADVRHIGPMAQDFHAAFELNGPDERHISVVDEGGVAFAAIQGLNEKLETDNTELRQENNLLAKRLDELEAQVKALAQKSQ